MMTFDLTFQEEEKKVPDKEVVKHESPEKRPAKKPRTRRKSNVASSYNTPYNNPVRDKKVVLNPFMLLTTLSRVV